MLFKKPLHPISDQRQSICDAYLLDETRLVKTLVEQFQFPETMLKQIDLLARELVQGVRSKQQAQNPIKALIHEFNLSTNEGIVLMCLAEALLRIPDAETADRLIHDKLSLADWGAHIGNNESWFVNTSTWAMLFTGKIVQAAHDPSEKWINTFERAIARVGEPIIRTALKQGMRWLGQQFVMGANIDHALARAASNPAYRYSFDMLGESALTQEDAKRYFQAYSDAIDSVGARANPDIDAMSNPGISVKLSALHPRYEFAKRERVMTEMLPLLVSLAQKAQSKNIGITIDAEEAERLDLSLDLFEAAIQESIFTGWNGFGLAVQAYQRRATYVIDYLADLAKKRKLRMPVRLVKGAYWDGEIKRAQERGWPSYPVFTRKPYTDVSYLACAQKMLKMRDVFYPQFATHNAHTVASLLTIAGNSNDYEFQRLHGMGDDLYAQIVERSDQRAQCRVYAPVGRYQDLLPYLVRRLLENGANTSFVSRIENENVSVDEIVTNPFLQAAQYEFRPNEKIPSPKDLFGVERLNSRGINFFDRGQLDELSQSFTERLWRAFPIVGEALTTNIARSVIDPATLKEIGTAYFADTETAEKAVKLVADGAKQWRLTPAQYRIDCVLKAAELFEQHREELILLCAREGGRTLPDAVAEVREAIDYCRYYAQQAQTLFTQPIDLPGPTGEQNQLFLTGRGVFACISPWNFPVAIFTGQIVAALVSGNAVIAKSASNTTLAGFRCVQILHEAGIPTDVLAYLPCDARIFNEKVLGDLAISGVAFTGSTDTAQAIMQRLLARGGPIIPVIAETGGQNVMITDSSALPEQVVLDAVQSAFNSAGQRCSALRVIYLQQEIADRALELLVGFAKQLTIGVPTYLETDVGPVISKNALQHLRDYVESRKHEGRLIYQATLPESLAGHFIGPAIIKLDNLAQLKEEMFGPILHVITYASGQLDNVIEEVNSSGYGLTLGIHSRIDQVVDYIVQRVHVGNIYVNRNMIGAVVGSQPFGGEGLSGTGPKAGGPHYLLRFCAERTVSTNTAAAGGNVRLLQEDRI